MNLINYIITNYSSLNYVNKDVKQRLLRKQKIKEKNKGSAKNRRQLMLLTQEAAH